MRRITAREFSKHGAGEIEEGTFCCFTTDRQGNPCVIVERDDGSVFYSYGLKDVAFISKTNDDDPDKIC